MMPSHCCRVLYAAIACMRQPAVHSFVEQYETSLTGVSKRLYWLLRVETQCQCLQLGRQRAAQTA